MKFNFKKYSTGILMLAIITSVSSCKKYLEEDSRSNFTQDNYFTSANQARTFVNGIYGGYINNINYGLYFFQNGDAYGEAPFITLELFAGHTTTLGQSTNNKKVINQNTDPTNPGFETVWKSCYTAIEECNLALARIPAINMDAAVKKSLLGEVYFLRAFYYYHLVRLYGDVPLLTAPVDLKSPLLYPERTPQAQVYDQVVNDLLAAEQSGLPNTDQTGRTSMGAVHTLLSSVYLTMAGYPLQKTENYAKAAAEAKQVLPLYTLFDNYAYLHDNPHKNQGELIFQSQYLVGVATNAITQLTVPFNLQVGAYGDHLGAMIPTDDFFKSYEAGDKRTEEKQFYFSKYPNANNPADTINFGEHCLYKYFQVESSVSGTANSGKCDENWTLLRLPEAMLTYAEASNEVNGPTADAYDAVNQIRTRANLKPLAGLSKDQFRIAIWKERYHELAYENKAYFDIQRTHQIYDVKNNTFGPATSTPNEQGVTMKAQYYLWPVPQRERNTNTKLTQNTGW
ncbi:RagB/SusD family nutrient uptake outer membrane protein [Mucilaginibacter sabulilitoris]|uniref:RagB/SusD family nutrient uptake outer membrane protein n=1 Tax=Mucilaginibacter sabulilitoris TaxID=1173583 RepID=A0ABZ0TL74_9SPHI|nr:RagB/SusD family nutrient uptake outer membrane protein [Mucilaginibacter sabulilitoris]WPU92285.1 RagB/SusD family nutrient uptake outer membrane protein [Mucilaginibacter sabulilitoris]